MKGIINKGIQELVEAKFGDQAWHKVMELAKCEEHFFSASEDYPDQLTLDLASAAAQVSGLPLETVLVEFGKFWVTNTAPRTYPTFFKLAGTSAREFLLSMGKVHDQVTRSVPNARPPRFDYEELPNARLLIHYRSERRLCAVLRGLIMGVGLHLGEELQVRETACANQGAPHCTMEVTFLGH